MKIYRGNTLFSPFTISGFPAKILMKQQTPARGLFKLIFMPKIAKKEIKSAKKTGKANTRKKTDLITPPRPAQKRILSKNKNTVEETLITDMTNESSQHHNILSRMTPEQIIQEKKKIALMWGGVGICMLIILAVWVFAFKASLRNDKMKADQGPNISSITDELNKSMAEMKKNLSALDPVDADAGSAEITATTTGDSALNGATSSLFKASSLPESETRTIKEIMISTNTPVQNIDLEELRSQLNNASPDNNPAN